MPEPLPADNSSLDKDANVIDLGNIDDETDTGDSEFEPLEENGAQDDDSIAADEDVADDEEVNGLMRESEMSLSDLLASYGLPPSAVSMESVTSQPASFGDRLTSRKRHHNNHDNSVTSTLIQTVADGTNQTSLEEEFCCKPSASQQVVSADGVCEVLGGKIEIDLTSSTGDGDDEEAVEDEHADEADDDDDDDDGDDDIGSEDGDDNGREDDDGKNHAVSLWCQALAAGDTPPAYNSEDDEDYQPNVEGEGHWRGEMHVGEEYQATVPTTMHPANSRQDSHLGSEARLVWQPGHLLEVDVERYQQTYSKILAVPAPISRIPDDEEALFFLLRSHFDTDEALHRLQMKPVQPPEIRPHLETWSEPDCVAFEKGFITFNKNFFLIQQNKLRHKTVSELVHFYYLWKKTARHDEFVRVYRREKKKPLHPGITDFMDCLMKEQLSSALHAEYLQTNRGSDVIGNCESGRTVLGGASKSNTEDFAAPSTPSLQEVASGECEVAIPPRLRFVAAPISVPTNSGSQVEA